MESPKINTSPQEETCLPVSEEKFGKEETPVMEYSEDSTSPQDEPFLSNEDIVTEPEEPYAINSTADSDFEKETHPQSPRENIPSAMEEDYAMEYNEDSTSPPNESSQPEEDSVKAENKEAYVMHSDDDNDSDNESLSPVRTPEIVRASSPVPEPRNEDSDSHEESLSLQDDFVPENASTAEEAPVKAYRPRTPVVKGTHSEESVSPAIRASEQPSPTGTDHSVPEKTYDMEDPFVDVPSAESPIVAERASPTLRETAPVTPKTPARVKTPAMNTTPVKQRTPAKERTPTTPKTPVRLRTPARENTSPVTERTPVAPAKTPILAPQVTDKESRLERARAVQESREARLREKATDMESAHVTAGKGAITKMKESFAKFRESFRAELHDLRSYQPSSDADKAPRPTKAAVSVIFLMGSYIFLLATIYGLTATSVFPFLSRFVF